MTGDDDDFVDSEKDGEVRYQGRPKGDIQGPKETVRDNNKDDLAFLALPRNAIGVTSSTSAVDLPRPTLGDCDNSADGLPETCIDGDNSSRTIDSSDNVVIENHLDPIPPTFSDDDCVVPEIHLEPIPPTFPDDDDNVVPSEVTGLLARLSVKSLAGHWMPRYTRPTRSRRVSVTSEG